VRISWAWFGASTSSPRIRDRTYGATHLAATLGYARSAKDSTTYIEEIQGQGTFGPGGASAEIDTGGA
jgi:hypothetical protein